MIEATEFLDGEERDETDYYDEEVSTFGDRVMAARESMGLSQKALASKLGIKMKTIRSWEEDRSEPRANKLQMLAGILNVSIMWLMNGSGPGLQGPEAVEFEGTETSADLIAELRAIRQEQAALISRMQRLEKQLRGALEG